MARKQDIITAIKNLDVFLKIEELKGSKVRFNQNGSPFVYTGGFNMVFQLTKKSKKWAFRVWHVPMGSTKERYQAISRYLTRTKLPYFADFIFEEKGIVAGGEFLDTIRMEWLDGLLFKEYLEKHLSNSQVLTKLAEDFLVMCEDLRRHNISHGDLQEGNILVDAAGKIKLVDYDSVYVPEIDGANELVTGLKGYQHPSRFMKRENKVSHKADYFSELIIYLSIQALAIKPDLWSKYQLKETSFLLFSDTDFLDLPKSQIYADLHCIDSKIDTLLSILIRYLESEDYTKLEQFGYYLLPPNVVYFKIAAETGGKGKEKELAWKVENALEVEINNGVGKVDTTGIIKVQLKTASEYILKAVGFHDTIRRRLSLNSGIVQDESFEAALARFSKDANHTSFESLYSFAESNHPRAMFHVGLALSQKNSIRENLPEGIKWLQRAADSGEELAQAYLGTCYLKGNGVELNPDLAFELFQKAAEFRVPEAFLGLGECFFQGKGTEKSLSNAIRYYRTARELGSKKASSRFIKNVLNSHFQSSLFYKLAPQLPPNILAECHSVYGNTVPEILMIYAHSKGLNIPTPSGMVWGENGIAWNYQRYPYSVTFCSWKDIELENVEMINRNTFRLFKSMDTSQAPKLYDREPGESLSKFKAALSEIKHFLKG